MLDLIEDIRRRAEITPRLTAVRFGDDVVTYGALDEAIDNGERKSCIATTEHQLLKADSKTRTRREAHVEVATGRLHGTRIGAPSRFCPSGPWVSLCALYQSPRHLHRRP